MRAVARVVTILYLCALMLSLSACRKTEPVSRTGFALDTLIEIRIYETKDGVNANEVLNACFTEIARCENLFSATVENSDIARINRAQGAAVAVAPETAQLLTESLKYAALSNGAFDVTLRSVTELWDFSAKRLPSEESLAAALENVGYQRLTVDGMTVTADGVKLDLGGIAKGYIADRVRDLLETNGVTSAMIDLGGNIVACGSKAGENWRIGVKDPNDTESLCAVITGEDIAVVTSGTYERGFDLDGVRYHHLLSPQTGMPVQNGLASVTITCRDAVQADALSTACFVLGEEKGKALIDSLDGVEALFVRADGTLAATAGLSYTIA